MPSAASASATRRTVPRWAAALAECQSLASGRLAGKGRRLPVETILHPTDGFATQSDASLWLPHKHHKHLQNRSIPSLQSARGENPERVVWPLSWAPCVIRLVSLSEIAEMAGA